MNPVVTEVQTCDGLIQYKGDNNQKTYESCSD
jgi:hypothetical protein